MKLSSITKNPNNPRSLTKEKFEKLRNSIESFPKMMELRPIVIDDSNVILGGNMRYSALKALGYKEIPDNWVKKASNLTDHEKEQFIIKDNVSFGLWDTDMLANEWDAESLNDWGLEAWDYSIEEEEEEEESEKEKEEKEESNTISLKINVDHLEEIKDLIGFWEEQKAYIGGMLLEKLRNEKAKLK